ncbi:P-loop containing nucleoside triphosphate hydrolase protein [Mycena rebaudengoi]|nr:P-loop containing nucleoside triphosphate hydrolase protein [Mycena rebaudengoi]
MRLTACVPSIPIHLVSILEKCGVKTVEEFLFSSSTFDIFRRLPVGATTLQELTECTAIVAELASAQGQSATDLLELHSESEEDRFLSGVPRLDELLRGLVASRRLIEVSGNKGSGKTSLLLHLVLRHLSCRPQSSVLWIDTTGDFSAGRAAEILEMEDGPGACTALERLQVSLAFEVDAVHDVLEELRICFTASTPPEFKIQGVVVDAVTPLLGPNLSPVSSQGHAIMSGFMRQLRAFAQAFSLTIFVPFTPYVPGSASNNPNIRKPALGKSFTFLTDATLWLASCDDGSVEQSEKEDYSRHMAQVYRSKVTMAKSLCSFKIQRGLVLAYEVA